MPPPELPREATIYTSSVMPHRFLITAKELEVIYSLVSADYLVSLQTGAFGTTGMVKTELSMQILQWNVRKPNKAKMNTVDQPVAKSFKAVSFSQKEEFDRYVRVRPGRAVYNKPTAEDESLHKDLGGAESAVLEETNMFQTDSRDLAADREAEEQEHYARTHGSTWTLTAEEKLAKCRAGKGQTFVGREMRAWNSHFESPVGSSSIG